VGLQRRRTDARGRVRRAGEDVDIAESAGGKRRVENVRRGQVDKEMKSCGHYGSNQSMKPTPATCVPPTANFALLPQVPAWLISFSLGHEAVSLTPGSLR